MKKHTLSRILALALTALLLFSITGCSEEPKSYEKIQKEEAETIIKDFLSAVSAGEFEKSEEYLHAGLPTDSQLFFDNLKNKTGIDFATEIKVDEMVELETDDYYEVVRGARYIMEVETTVQERHVCFLFEIVRNDEDYGLYNVDVTIKDQK